MVTKFIAIASLFALTAHAQTNPHNGSWEVTLKTLRGGTVNGEAIVENEAGSWQVVVRGAEDPCLGRKYPISVQKSTAEELVFEIQRSKVLAGCRDTMMTMKLVDSSTLRGEFNNVPFYMKKK